MPTTKETYQQGIALRSEEVQEILSAVPHWMLRWGNGIILLLLVLFLALSWFIKYPDTIQAQALVTTQIPPEQLQAHSTGKFDAFLVKDGDTVQANQPLAVLENTANYHDVLYLKNVIDTLHIDYHHFEFPLAQLPVLFLGEVDQAFALFENNYTDLVLYRELQPFNNEFSANKISLTENKQRLNLQYKQLKIAKKTLALKKQTLDRNQILFQKGILSQQEIEQQELLFLQEKRAYESMRASISNVREQVSNSRKNFKGNAIRKKQEENKRIKQVIQSYNQLQKALKDWEMRYLFQAKIAGKVSLLGVYNKNQQVQNGDIVFVIIPKENNGYIAKIKAPDQNAGKLKIGQRVSIKLANYPYQEFGMLQGTIQTISALRDKDGNYLIDVVLSNGLVSSYNKKIPFQQEMQGTAEIVTEDLRLIERFFYQLRGLVSRK